MSKKNNKIQLANISAQAISLLSGYSEAVVGLKALKDTYKKGIEEQQKNMNTLLAEAAGDDVTADRKVEIEQAVFTIQQNIRRLDAQFAEDKKPFVKAKADALALVPANIYSGYVAAWESGKTGQWERDIKEFIVAMGITVGDCTAIKNFADLFKIRCAGSRNDNDNLIKVKGQRTFDDTVIRCFIQHCVIEKGVLDRDKQGAITRHDFTK